MSSPSHASRSLRILTAGFTALFALASAARAQSAADANTGSRIALDPDTGVFIYSYWSVAGRTYFLQHSDDLAQWNYIPVIEQGVDAITRYAFVRSSGWTKFFLRLRHTDAPTGGDPYTADFDADGIPNGFEVEHGLNPFNAADAAAIVGGLTNLELYQQSLGAGADPTTTLAAGLIVYTP